MKEFFRFFTYAKYGLVSLKRGEQYPILERNKEKYEKIRYFSFRILLGISIASIGFLALVISPTIGKTFSKQYGSKILCILALFWAIHNVIETTFRSYDFNKEEDRKIYKDIFLNYFAIIFIFFLTWFLTFGENMLGVKITW